MPLINSREDRLSIFVFVYASGTILCLERHLVEGLSLSPEIETSILFTKSHTFPLMSFLRVSWLIKTTRFWLNLFTVTGLSHFLERFESISGLLLLAMAMLKQMRLSKLRTVAWPNEYDMPAKGTKEARWYQRITRVTHVILLYGRGSLVLP